MNKRTKMMIMFLAMIMVSMLFLTACGKNPSNQEVASTATTAPSNTTSSGKGDTKAPAELTMAFPIYGAMPKDMNLVEAEVNKITKAKINATVKLLPINSGNWVQQTNLMMSSNDKLDLMTINGGGSVYSSLVAKGQLKPLDDLLAQYGKGISAALDPAYLNAPKMDGKIYGVASIRDLAKNYGFVMRKDIVDKYNIDISKIKTLDDVEAVLKIVKEKEPELTPIASGGTGSTFLKVYKPEDPLVDGFGVLPGYDNNMKVVNYQESPEYAALIKRFRSWYQAGYVIKDAATSQTSTSDLVKSGKLFGYLAGMKPGYDAQESRASTYQMVTVQLLDPVATTGTITNLMWGIPQNSAYPERAMMLLNLLYTDKDLINLLDWGIEGKHYVKVSDNMIDFPPGIDAKNSGYYLGLSWIFGNQFLSYVFKGDDPDIWKKMDEFNKSAKKSKALGFNFNTESVKTEITAVTNVVNQYQKGLETGTLDPDKALPDYNAKLKSAGIDKIIQEKQKQLDAWVSAKK
ncbi:ABC transporter substrate-binding protein [Paenibacillus anseongense]|uniref:ABC transporter substrate-binding protein n=1 Tax=Paenibacillus TaxID=44249 RepID=UPI002DB9F7D2|nr:ABC transporter substrate-binding protein [Paenibacillus anseongense]MEC0266361.1 ABC transporter substrate-binding protein [Paenibacillus anseongense]